MSVYLIIGALGGAKVTLSGASIFTGVHTAPDPGTAFVRFNTNGTVDSLIDGVTTQLSSATDWIIPNTAANGSYEIFAHLNSGNAPTGSAAMDTWLALSSARQWGYSSAALNVSCALQISIRNSGGATISTAVYSVGVIEV